MNTYSKQVTCINKIARHFAMLNYLVTTTFFSFLGGCQVTIFFYAIKQKESIFKDLCQFKDDDDLITFDIFGESSQEGNHRKTYTYKLQKPSL